MNLKETFGCRIFLLSTATDEDVAELKAVSKKWSQRMESTKKPSTSNVTDLIVQVIQLLVLKESFQKQKCIVTDILLTVSMM